MTYKNEKIRNATLIALFTLALLVSGTAMQSANASVNPIVNVDRLVTDMSSTQTEISKLTANPVNNAVKIEALNERFWTTNDLINTMTNVEPKRDFVSEWKTLEQKQDSVKNTLTVLKKFGIAQSFDQTLNTQITQTEIDIEQLRQDSIRSMILDPKIQKELEAIQNRIHQEYPHILDSAIDSEQQKVSVLVDYDVVSNTNATLAMLQTFGIDKVMVEGLPEITGCTMTKMKCSPALGGLAIVRPDETSTRGFSGSIGYKASNSNGDTGFVTAGHVADWSTYSSSGSSNSVMNFFDGTKIGDVTEAYGIKSPARTDGKKHVDVAFVKTSKITDDIFLYKNVQLDTVSYANAKSDHVKGDLIYRIGAASGLQDYGYIKKVYKNTDIIKHGGMTVKIGDSGGTIYQKNSQGKAIVLGHVTSTLFYIPAYKVIDLYGITPLTR